MIYIHCGYLVTYSNRWWVFNFAWSRNEFIWKLLLLTWTVIFIIEGQLHSCTEYNRSACSFTLLLTWSCCPLSTIRNPLNEWIEWVRAVRKPSHLSNGVRKTNQSLITIRRDPTEWTSLTSPSFYYFISFRTNAIISGQPPLPLRVGTIVLNSLEEWYRESPISISTRKALKLKFQFLESPFLWPVGSVASCLGDPLPLAFATDAMHVEIQAMPKATGKIPKRIAFVGSRYKHVRIQVTCNITEKCFFDDTAYEPVTIGTHWSSHTASSQTPTYPLWVRIWCGVSDPLVTGS